MRIHTVHFLKFKSAGFCKILGPRFDKKVWSASLLQVKNIIQEYNAPKFMRAVALGQILISYFHTLNTDEELPLSSCCVNEKISTS